MKHRGKSKPTKKNSKKITKEDLKVTIIKNFVDEGGSDKSSQSSGSINLISSQMQKSEQISAFQSISEENLSPQDSSKKELKQELAKQ